MRGRQDELVREAVKRSRRARKRGKPPSGQVLSNTDGNLILWLFGLLIISKLVWAFGGYAFIPLANALLGGGFAYLTVKTIAGRQAARSKLHYRLASFVACAAIAAVFLYALVDEPFADLLWDFLDEVLSD